MLRVIPRLDIKGPNLVKGVHLEGLRVLGSPERFARHYATTGADELIYVDVVASLYGRNSLLDVVERTAADVFIPLTVGGGIRTLDDVTAVLRAGADKVAVNTAAVADPDFVRRASRRFGSSTIVVSIEVIRVGDRCEVFTDNGREATGRDALEWAVEAVELGAGELLVTSVDREGTGRGYDVELTRSISDAVGVPVIACGGAGTPTHVVEVVEAGGADAVAAASVLHYRCVADGLGATSSSGEGNDEFIRRPRLPGRLTPSTVGELKVALLDAGIACREVR